VTNACVYNQCMQELNRQRISSVIRFVILEGYRLVYIYYTCADSMQDLYTCMDTEWIRVRMFLENNGVVRTKRTLYKGYLPIMDTLLWSHGVCNSEVPP
jgi:hypothetical protein